MKNEEIELDLLEDIFREYTGIEKFEILSYGIFDELRDDMTPTGEKYFQVNYILFGQTKPFLESIPSEFYKVYMREIKLKKLLENLR